MINNLRLLKIAGLTLATVTMSSPSNAISLMPSVNSIETPSYIELDIFPALKGIQDIDGASHNYGFQKISGYTYVKPYFRRDGTFVQGHLRTNPDGYCFNNFSGC